MEKIYKDVEFMGYPKKERIYNNSSVEAIPIEWIRNYISSIGGSNGVTKLHKEILKTMLKDWEKENEMR